MHSSFSFALRCSSAYVLFMAQCMFLCGQSFVSTILLCAKTTMFCRNVCVYANLWVSDDMSSGCSLMFSSVGPPGKKRHSGANPRWILRNFANRFGHTPKWCDLAAVMPGVRFCVNCKRGCFQRDSCMFSRGFASILVFFGRFC